MTTIDELIDALYTDERGQIFLINLYHTLTRPYFSATEVHAVCEELLYELNVGGHAMPAAAVLADRLGGKCVVRGLWENAPEPILEHHMPKSDFALCRVISYSNFFKYILKRVSGSPTTIPDMPEPLEISAINSSEIESRNVRKVRQIIDSGEWRDLIISANVNFTMSCNWLAPLPKLKKNISSGVIEQADLHRDIIGLSHLIKGQHLIRLDLDLGHWLDWHSILRRRPHGAGNGGNRFRLLYDGGEKKCRWGRTVNLARIETGSANSLNGIPELLMGNFTIPKNNINAMYLGQILREPENNDTFFIKRLRKRKTLINIISDLKRVLI